MSEKMTCPCCESYTSALLSAVENGDPCPYCGLSAGAILEVNALDRSLADQELRERAMALTIECDKLRTENQTLASQLDSIRRAVNSISP